MHILHFFLHFLTQEKIGFKLSEIMVGSRIQGSKRYRIPNPDPQHWNSEGSEKYSRDNLNFFFSWSRKFVLYLFWKNLIIYHIFYKKNIINFMIGGGRAFGIFLKELRKFLPAPLSSPAGTADFNVSFCQQRSLKHIVLFKLCSRHLV